MLHVKVTSKKQGRKRWLQAGMWTVGLALLGCAGYGTYLAMKSLAEEVIFDNRTFTIERIEVYLPSSGSLSRADVLSQGGVAEGGNLFAVDLNAVTKRIEALPSVQKACVARELPSTLKITVEERQPVAIIRPDSRTGSRLLQEVFYIDENGYVMKPVPGEDLKRLPVIRGVAADYVIEGSKMDRPEVLSALNLIRQVDFSDLKSDLDLRVIRVVRGEYLVIRTLKDQGLVRFRVDFLGEQVKRLRSVLDFANREGRVVKMIDLTPNQYVATKM